ncbi:MAG TPA: hypothetical protein DEF25_09860 [Thermoanaerobacter sp.]|uniref:Uncharacterized protein n=1 Tax=Sulfurihydrogenibium yellowstonense SS-5 TaxID=432331 RepID=C4FJ22_9AQUI|nr:hypothetical protein SULYE_0563 [Sulfurihydrogenibium yellowstonense SS-5]HBW60497.1 hypothetical protein [Thermoanaerobacter sp.]
MTVGIVVGIALASILKRVKICQKFIKRKFIKYVTNKRSLLILLNRNPVINLNYITFYKNKS